MPNRKSSKPKPPPFVAPQVIGNRLVRVCPECRVEIVERTDEDGTISDRFSEHYEAEHRHVEPERQRCYLLAMKSRTPGQHGSGDEATRNLSQIALRRVRQQITEVDWELADELADVPLEAPIIQAAHIMLAGFAKEPAERQVRWFKRTEQGLTFTPTEKQIAAWEAVTDRVYQYREALIQRHRDDAPKFTGKSADAWQQWYDGEYKPWADAIAKDFDARRQAASHEFWTGGTGWRAMFDAAIAELDIPEDEVEALRADRAAALAAGAERLKG